MLARDLDEAGHDVTIVDERVGAFSRLGEGFGGNMVVGTGIDESVLRRAGIEKADCFASTRGNYQLTTKEHKGHNGYVRGRISTSCRIATVPGVCPNSAPAKNISKRTRRSPLIGRRFV